MCQKLFHNKLFEKHDFQDKKMRVKSTIPYRLTGGTERQSGCSGLEPSNGRKIWLVIALELFLISRCSIILTDLFNNKERHPSSLRIPNRRILCYLVAAL